MGCKYSVLLSSNLRVDQLRIQIKRRISNASTAAMSNQISPGYLHNQGTFIGRIIGARPGCTMISPGLPYLSRGVNRTVPIRVQPGAEPVSAISTVVFPASRPSSTWIDQLASRWPRQSLPYDETAWSVYVPSNFSRSSSGFPCVPSRSIDPSSWMPSSKSGTVTVEMPGRRRS